MAEKQKREREILQNKLAAAVEIVGEGDEVIFGKDRKKGLLQNLFKTLNSIVEYFKPFKKDIKDIVINYDKSIGIFYEITQIIYVFTVFNALLYTHLIFTHYMNYKDNVQYYKGLCGYCFPCIFFYSRFQPDSNREFAIVNIVFIAVGMFLVIYLWLKFDKKAQY